MSLSARAQPWGGSGVRAFLSASMRLLEREQPRSYLRLCAMLDRRWAKLVIDAEVVEVAFTGGGFTLGRLRGDPLTEVVSSRRAILDVLDGELDLETAVWEERVVLRGHLEDLVVFHDALVVYLNGAVRSPSFPPLLDRFVESRRRTGNKVGAKRGAR